MLRRLMSRVDKDEIAVTGCNETTEAIDKLRKEKFDMVIVDNFVRDAEQVCLQTINYTQVPVAVMLQEKIADWSALQNLEVNGYLPDEGGRDELMARIRAFSRRSLTRGR